MSKGISIKNFGFNYLDVFSNDKLIPILNFDDAQFDESFSLKSTNIKNWLGKDFLLSDSSSLIGKILDQDRKEISSNENLDGPSSDTTANSSLLDSNEATNINYLNDKFMNTLRKRTKAFVKLIIRTPFVDGMTNDTIEEAKSYYFQNRSVTINWFYEIYTQNQTNAVVISGLLRIISMIVDVSDRNVLIPIVKCGLADNTSMVQESALMVVEEWRTKECLEAIQTSTFSSSWMKSYAQKVMLELKNELRQ